MEVQLANLKGIESYIIDTLCSLNCALVVSSIDSGLKSSTGQYYQFDEDSARLLHSEGLVQYFPHSFIESILFIVQKTEFFTFTIFTPTFKACKGLFIDCLYSKRRRKQFDFWKSSTICLVLALQSRILRGDSQIYNQLIHESYVRLSYFSSFTDQREER